MHACADLYLISASWTCRHSETSLDRTPMSAQTSLDRLSTLCGTLVTLLTPSHPSPTTPRLAMLSPAA